MFVTLFVCMVCMSVAVHHLSPRRRCAMMIDVPPPTPPRLPAPAPLRWLEHGARSGWMWISLSRASRENFPLSAAHSGRFGFRFSRHFSTDFYDASISNVRTSFLALTDVGYRRADPRDIYLQPGGKREGRPAPCWHCATPPATRGRIPRVDPHTHTATLNVQRGTWCRRAAAREVPARPALTPPSCGRSSPR